MPHSITTAVLKLKLKLLRRKGRRICAALTAAVMIIAILPMSNIARAEENVSPVTKEKNTKNLKLSSYLRDITINKVHLNGFERDKFTYEVQLPKESANVPKITAIPYYSDSKVSVTNATELPGTTVIKVIGINGIQKKYSIHFTRTDSPPIRTVKATNKAEVNSLASPGNKANPLEEDNTDEEDTTPPADVTNLKAAPNEQNNAILLSWTNPTEDFYYASIYKYVDYGEGYNFWDWLGDTDKNSFTDIYTDMYETYKYKVLVVDKAGHESSNPPVIEGSLRPETLSFDYWDLTDDGTCTPYNMDWFYVDVGFKAADEVASITFDNAPVGTDNWQSLESYVTYDYGLYGYNHYYSHEVRLDLTNLPDGSFRLRATAKDVNNNTLSKETVLKKDSTPPGEVTNLTSVANEDNSAIVISWNNPSDKDFDHAALYKKTNSGSWRLLREVTESSYTDTTVEEYVSYSYKVTTVDAFGNESSSPPVTAATLTVPPISFEHWDITNNGICSSDNKDYFYIEANFRATEDLTSIKYEYALKGTDLWQSFSPYITSEYELYGYDHYWYQEIYLNLSGLPDGSYRLRATAEDKSGHKLSEETSLEKDTKAPAEVTNLKASIDTAGSSVVLTWVNPTEDFSYVNVQRSRTGESYWENLSTNLVKETYTDTTAIKGIGYDYRIMVYDKVKNQCKNPVKVTFVIPVDRPVLDSMSPNDGIITNSNSIYYQARFIDNREIISILFEISTDGNNWVKLNEFSQTPSRSNNYYTKSGYWDLNSIGEATYQIRATASNSSGISSSGIRIITVDHMSPPGALNFKADKAASGTGVYVSWDEVPGAASYNLSWKSINPNDNDYGDSTTIYSPAHSYNHVYAQEGKTYIYTLTAHDKAGNVGAKVTTYGEYYQGPNLELEGSPEVITTGSAYTLKGQTTPGTSVTVNSNSVTSDSSGGFTYSTLLSEGNNIFTVKASLNRLTHTKMQVVTLDRVQPLLTSFSPESNTVLSSKSNQTLTASAHDRSGSGISRILFQISMDDGQTWSDITVQQRDQLSEYYYGYWDSTLGKYFPSWQASLKWDTKLNGSFVPDGAYKFRAVAYDRAGNSTDGTPVNIWKVDNTPPSAPKGLQASADVEKITLHWTPNTESDLSYYGYNVYRTTTAGKNYQLITNTEYTSYTDTNVTAGTTYYYIIAAKDRTGNESSSSNEVSVIPLADTTSPDIDSITYGDYYYGSTLSEGTTIGGPSIRFLVYTQDDSPKGVASYKYDYSTDSGATWQSMSGSTGTSSYYNLVYGYIYWNTSGLTSGSYKLRFTAIDHSGNESFETRNIVLDKTASVPQNVKAEPAEGKVILSWDQISDSDFRSYEVLYSVTEFGTYQSLENVYDKATTIYSYNGGKIGKTYYFKVRFNDSYGNYNESAVIAAAPLDDITPPELTEASIQDGATTGGPQVHFTVKATDNKAVSDMKAYYSTNEGLSWTEMDGSKSGPYNSSEYYISDFYWDTEGLAAGEYKIRLKAFDAAKNEVSQDFTWKLDFAVSPVSTMRTVSGENNLTIEWDPINDTDINTYGYRILRSTSPDTGFSNRSGWLSNSITSYTDTGLAPKTTYYYIIETQDSFENKARSTSVTGSLLSDTTVPYIHSVTPAAGTTIGGTGLEKMTVYFSDNAGMTAARAELSYSPDGRNWAKVPYPSGPYDSYDGKYYFYWNWNKELLESRTYTLKYTVYDGSDNKTEYTALYVVDRTGPTAPQDLIGTYGSGTVSLTWQPSPEANVSYYSLYRATSSVGPFTLLRSTTDKSYTDTTAEPGLTYYYRVSATDKFGQEGDFSNTAAAAAFIDTTAPIVLSMSPQSNTLFGANAAITVSASDNSALSSVTLQYESLDGLNWIDIDTKAIAQGQFVTFDWKTAPLNGSIKVRAIARDSTGNISDGQPERIYRLDNSGPSKVENISTEPSSSGVLLRWADVPEEDYYYFLVEKKSSETSQFQEVGKVYNQLGMNVTGLEANSSYWFRITAFDRLGNCGTPSDIVKTDTTVDTAAPYIVSLLPMPDSFAKLIKLHGSAKDNLHISLFTFQYSTDLKQWTDIITLTPENAPADALVSYDWDISGLSEGSCYVRAIAEDSFGNKSSTETSPYVEYRIDHTPPSAAMDFTVKSDSAHILLNWKTAADQTDVKAFNVFRALAQVGPYTKIASEISTLGYYDTNTEQNVTYYYKVTSIDRAGNEGTATEILSSQLAEDIAVPEIISVSPAADSKLAANPTLYVLASDNYRVSKVSIMYKPTEGNGNWINIEEKTLNQRNGNVTFNWDTSGLSDGSYTVRSVAIDNGGRASQPKDINYVLNVSPPARPTLTAKSGGWHVELSWTSGNEEDLAGFYVYRALQSGGPYERIEETTETSYKDEPLVPSRAYYYVVESVDKYRNINRSAEVSVRPTTDDRYNPIAEAGENQIVVSGMQFGFDGLLSKDNDTIVSYYWDFGDGLTGFTAQPTHIYEKPGDYTVTLTVRDRSGNTATDTTLVSVRPPQLAGTVEVLVIDDVSGEPISDASVVIQLLNGTAQKVNTDSHGIASVVADAGDYKVYAYKKDFKPASKEVSMTLNQKTRATIRLQRGELIVGELTVKKMTLEEIVAAGIDIHAPENQWVYKYEIHLTFNNQPLAPAEFLVNGAGNFVAGPVEPLVITTNGPGSLSTMLAYPVAIPHENHPEVRPTVAYMVIPGEARFLKDFFEVGLTLENTADPEFVIEKSTATLKLPDGLVLAPTREQQNLQINLGSIVGGEKRQAKWIIRADKKGSFAIEADFNGILQPFGEPVQKLFKTKEDLKIWGEDAVVLHVDTQQNTNAAYPYNVRFGIENISEVPVDNVKLQLKDDEKHYYIYAPNQELTKNIKQLKAGETVWLDYWLIPCSKGVVDIAGSYELSVGSNTEIKTECTTHHVQQNEPGEAPVLHQTILSHNKVELSWDSIPGAEGYKIYFIRKDWKMSAEPELVYTATKDITSVVLAELEGPRDYIITTITSSGESLKHAITGMSWCQPPDRTPPTAAAEYNLTEPTNQNVIVTIVPSEPVTVTNNSGSFTHLFTENGEFTFEFKDAAGNTGTVTAVVNNIDKTAPTGTVEYSIAETTNQNVIVTLKPSETVTVTNNSGLLTYTFTENGEFTFEFKDAAGNTGSAKAVVKNIQKELPQDSENPEEPEIHQVPVPNNTEDIVDAINTPEIKDIVVVTDSNTTVDQSVLEAVKGTDKTVTFESKDESGTVVYSWTFNGEEIKGATTDINLNLSLNTELTKALAEKIKKIDVFAFAFQEEGILPGKVEIKIKLDETWLGGKDKEHIFLYSYNPETNKLELAAKDLKVDNHGYIKFKTDYCGDYLASDKDLGTSVQLPKTGSIFDFNLLVGIGILFILLGAAAIAFRRKKE